MVGGRPSQQPTPTPLRHSLTSTRGHTANKHSFTITSPQQSQKHTTLRKTMVGASHQRLHIQQPTPTPLPHPHMPQTIRFKAPGNKHGSTQSPERTTSNGRREAKPTTNTGTMLQQHSFISTSPQQAQKHTTLTKTMVVAFHHRLHIQRPKSTPLPPEENTAQ